jgi:hypothetical protein
MSLNPIGVALAAVSAAVAISELCHVKGPLNVAPIPVQQVVAGGSVTGPFDVDVDFESNAPYRCGCCEFRQYIRAQTGQIPYSEDGNPVNYRVVDPSDTTKRVNLGESPMEDYPDYGGNKVRYGHRDEAQSANESYTNGGSGPNAGAVNRATGCHYHSHDAPGINNIQAGHHYSVALAFHVEIVCPATGCGGTGGAPHAQKDWTVTLNH